jgi:hypothetical protein
MVNAYCTRDFVLRVVHRMHQMAWETAGLRPIGVQPHSDLYSALSEDLALPDATPVLRSLHQHAMELGMPTTLPTLPGLPTVASMMGGGSTSASAQWKAAAYEDDGDAPAEAFASIAPAPVEAFGVSSLPPSCATGESWRGITSVNLTHLVHGHLEYRNKLAAAMDFIGMDTAV